MDAQAANAAPVMDIAAYAIAQERRDPQYRLLNVNNFGLEHLDGKRAPPPNMR